ncbi:MAG: DUF6468 domain-containing protein [Alphaproteobacteria bacterium]
MTDGLSLSVVADALIVVLLVATIVYAVVLNRKLSALRSAKAEMEALVARFAESTAQAESGIQSLKAHANESGVSLDSKANKAHGLADDLAFLIERGSDLANRLEGAIALARGNGAGNSRPDRPQSPGDKPSPAKAPPVAEVSPEEAAVLNALRGVR